jgi:hypothetical protein
MGASVISVTNINVLSSSCTCYVQGDWNEGDTVRLSINNTECIIDIPYVSSRVNLHKDTRNNVNVGNLNNDGISGTKTSANLTFTSNVEMNGLKNTNFTCIFTDGSSAQINNVSFSNGTYTLGIEGN